MSVVYITQEVADRVLAIMDGGEKVKAVKELRRVTSQGLKESKISIEMRFNSDSPIQVEAESKQEALIASYMKLNEQMSDVFVKMIELLEEK